MSWTFGSVRIYVSDLGGADKQTIARLQPVSGGTVHQVFGYENEIKKVKGLVIGETDLSTLKGYGQDGTTHNLTGYGTDYGNFYLSTLNWTRLNVIYQTVTDDCDAPVFSVDLELYG